MSKKIIQLPEENLQGLHFYKENLSFPVIIGTYSSWEESQITYLNLSVSTMKTLDICKWCINHKIHYQILYPINKQEILKDPIRFIFYLILKHKINML